MSEPASAIDHNHDATLGSCAVRIAHLLGLPRWQEMSDIALVRRIEAGLPLETVERVARALGPGEDAAAFSLMSRATRSRLLKTKEQRLTKDMSEKVYGVARVVSEALRLWDGDRAATGRFLSRPHQLLDGRTPIDVARESTVGADLVVRLIGEARAGVAV